MRKAAAAGGWALTLALMLPGGARAEGKAGIRFYAGLEGGYTFVSMQSGGFNTAGGFRNHGHDGCTILVPSGHVGLEWNRMVRLDLGYRKLSGLQFTTSGYSADFPYRATAEAGLASLSLLLKLRPKNSVSPYVGAGLARASIEGTATDLVVDGSGAAKRLAWQAEAGIQIDPRGPFSVRLGYRRTAVGELAISLTEGGAAAGSYTAALTADEVVFEARIRL